MEKIAGIPCFEIFDMLLGTSTGGIIASFITTGRTAEEIETHYTNLINEVFHKKLLGNRFINPPSFSKTKYRQLLKAAVGDVVLGEACQEKNIDFLVMAQDISATEETFLACFKQDDGLYYSTYKNVLLHAVTEATMSAPTFF
jgi:uncharacterized protein